MKCIHCKRTIEDDSEFCVYCGSKVTPYDNSIFEEKKKNKVPIIAGILGACILIVCICFVMLFISEKKSDSTLESVADISEIQDEIKEKSEEENYNYKAEDKSQETEKEVTDRVGNKDSEITSENTEEKIESNVPDTGSTDYILPDSSQRILSNDEINILSKADLRLARNEIYARHGRKFDDQELQNYFNSKSWYRGSIEPDDFSESFLSEIEKANIDTIKKYEK